MPFNGSGVFAPPAADFPAVSGTLILATHFNNVQNDVATGLSDCVTRDGQSAATANLPMGGFRHTNISDATARNQYASAAQAQDSSVIWAGTAAGTADALTMALTPPITAYAAGQVFNFKSSASPNATTTPTVAINGLAAKTIQKGGGALVAGDIEASKYYSILYDGTNFQLEAVGTLNLSGTNAWSGTNTFVDSLFSINDNAAPTKQIGFEASSITAGQRRTVTVPDMNLTLVPMLVKRKLADESVTSSTVLQNDDDLFFPIGANEEWIATFSFQMGNALTTTGIKVAITVPAAGTQKFQSVVETSDTACALNGSMNAQTVSGTAILNIPAGATFGTAAFCLVRIIVWMQNGANAGNVQIQWSQATSSGTALTVTQGSSMVAHRIA